MSNGFKDEIRRRAELKGWRDVKQRIFGLPTTIPIPEAGSEIGNSVLIDFHMDVRGVDERSSSRLAIRKDDGAIKHGALRAGEVDVEESGITRDELETRWVAMVEDVGIDFDRDEAGVEMRQIGRNEYVPHVIFGGVDGVSPITPDRMVGIIEELPRLWNNRTQDLNLRGRIQRGDFDGEERTVGTVDDMLDNI